jgi:4-amino-4-deoxy-L-arabinose transferase-like glycosyltransferase
MAVGLLARLVLIWRVGGTPAGALSGGSDAPAYILLGNAIAHGKGLTYVGQPTALRAPLYPLMLGFLDRFFGSYSLLVMRFVQFIAAVLTAFFCAETAAQLWGRNSKWTTFALTLFMPTLLFFTPQILTETFTACFVSLFLYFLVQARSKESWMPLVAMGTCAGILMLLRFNAIFLPLVIVCAAFQIPIRSISTRRAIVPLVVAALIVCPWVIRNAIVFHGGILYSSQTGLTALQGVLSPAGRTQPWESNTWKRAGWWLSDIETDNPIRLQFPSEVELNRQAKYQAYLAWKSEGFHVFRLLTKKVCYFWLSTDQLLETSSFPRSQRILRAAGVFFYWGTLAVAILGWLRLRTATPRIANLLWLYCVAATVLHLPFTMNTRLRVPLIDPIICILVGGELSAVFVGAGAFTPKPKSQDRSDRLYDSTTLDR